MIGQRISGTVWQITWRHNAPTKDPDKPAPVSGRSVIITADPTGSDVVDVGRLVVLGAQPAPDAQFSVLEMTRIAEVEGLASLPANDRGWPAPITTGAALLEAGTRQLAAMHDVTKRLVLEQTHCRQLEAENAALWAVAKVVDEHPMLSQAAWEPLGDAKAARETRIEVAAMVQACAAPGARG